MDLNSLFILLCSATISSAAIYAFTTIVKELRELRESCVAFTQALHQTEFRNTK